MAHKAECTPMDRWLDVAVGGGGVAQANANANADAAP